MSIWSTVTVIGFVLWAAFGALRQEWPIILTNTACFFLAGYILFRKLRSS